MCATARPDAADDLRLLRRALALARANAERRDGGPFGAVVARGGEALAEGTNRVTAAADPTAHAEIEAIRAACARLGSFELAGCTLYTSCEPCPMCLAAAYWARLERIVYAGARGDAAEAGFDDDRIYRELPMAPTERSLPMERLLADEGRQPFAAWLADPGRVPY